MRNEREWNAFLEIRINSSVCEEENQQKSKHFFEWNINTCGIDMRYFLREQKTQKIKN